MKIGDSTILTGSESLKDLNKLLAEDELAAGKKFVLVDEQTLQLCLPILLSEVPELKNAEIIEIESGEASKNIEVCTQIWSALSDMEADRHSIFLNLGGGVISDMGGYIASCFMRGIRFINVPTTLLAQVDAAIGGKTGVDLGNLKNHVGVFNHAEAVVISTKFLRSLGKRELLAGFAEMLKHALIADPDYWAALSKIDFSEVNQLELPILHSIEIKNEIVLQDPTEQGLRKSLNFGHTIGHAIESYSMEGQQNSLLHGEAVAIGMICEAFLSAELGNLSAAELEEITAVLLKLFKPYLIEELAYNRIIELMRHDKKNVNGELNFTFLDSIGSCNVNQTASPQDIKHALKFYRIHANQS